jgi:glycosyl transferase family 87
MTQVWRTAAAAVISLIALLAAWGVTPGVTRAIGEQDDLLFRNFHEPERKSGVFLRWSKGGPRGPARASAIVLPQVGCGPGGRLDLQVRAPGDQVVPVVVEADGETLLSTSVQGRQGIAVTVPGRACVGGTIEVTLGAPASVEARDPRPRGVAVERVRWSPTGWTAPPPRQLWVVPLFAAALTALALRLWPSSLAAALACTIAGSFVALGAAWRPLEVAPYTHRLLLSVLLVHVALLLWSAIVRPPGGPWWRLPAAVTPEALLLLMGIGYWTLFAFHEALCLEGGVLCPTRAASAIGPAVVVALAGTALFARDSSRVALAIAVLAAGATAEAVAATAFALRRPAVDFATLWTGARDFRQGGSLYRLDDVVANHFGPVFKVPPFYGMLLVPFAGWAMRSALAVHRVLNVAFYLVTASLLVGLLRSRLGVARALATVAIVMGLMQPPFDTIAYGQIDIALLLLLTIALIGFRRGWPALSGGAIAAATLLKLYPLLSAGFFLAQRQWRAAVWTAAWLGGLTALAVAAMGWPEHVTYATAVLPRIGGGTGWIENQTWNGFLCRLLTGAIAPQPVHERSVDVLTAAGFAVVTGASLWAASRPSERLSSQAAVQFSLMAVAMVLAVPAAWIHYSTILALPFVALVWAAADRPFTRAGAFAIALSFALVGYGNQWSFFGGGQPGRGLALLALSQKFYGLALLLVVMLARAAGNGEKAPGP